MNGFNKIGLCVSGDYDSDNLRAWMRRLDGAGVPFFAVFDAPTAAFRRAQTFAAEGAAIGHTVVYRSRGGPAEPDYQAPPDAAAAVFWEAHRAALPPELDPAVAWLELMQIGEGGQRQPDWLGVFVTTLAGLVLDDGYRMAAFSFAAGQPDAALWEREAIIHYLRLCEANPGRLGVALREYSREVGNIWYRRDLHIGRFYNLFALCNRAKIARPPVLITEWGWTPDRLPSARRGAMDDIAAIAEYYAPYPEILGAALYRVGAGDTPIDRQGRRLIRPLTDFSLSTEFVIESSLESLPQDEATISKGTQTQANARFVSDVTVPDDTRMQAGAPFVKTWRVQNTGLVDWGPAFRLVHAGGEPMAAQSAFPLPVIRKGEVGEVSVPMTVPATPGVHFSDWRFQDDLGVNFGDLVYVRLEAVAAPQPAGALPGAKFVADVTVPDDSPIEPGAAFTKTWRLRNTGAQAWTTAFTINFVGGASLAGATRFPLPPAAPGAEVEVSIPMTAPMASGTYYADWRLKDAAGQPFGDMVYVRFVVPRPAGPTLAAPVSQQDPRWKAKRLGEAGSPKTIGEWGCMLVALGMTANALGKPADPSVLNDKLIDVDGFLDLYKTKWGALSLAYTDIVFDGREETGPNILDKINASLDAGVPVPIQVDFTRDTPYTENDQHWVLVVAPDGDDYRINDPWLLPPQEASLMDRYGRSGQPLRESIMAALFHRLAGIESLLGGAGGSPAAKPAPGRLERGMNVNPDAPNSNPYESNELKGMDWVRFVYKISARLPASEREDINKAFDQYDPIVNTYNQMGTKCLIILNQETVWGIAPWTGSKDWQTYADQLAAAAGQIASRYRKYGDRVAYQIWNEGDKKNNPASVYVEPENYAVVLSETAAAIRAASPASPVIFNGMATGPQESIAYIKRVQQKLGGTLPVDAVGIHPYTRWATKAPFDWGRRYGTLGDAFAAYRRAFPKLKLWITEIGVADDNELGPQYYAEIADYFRDIFTFVESRYTEQVPVVIWFAWSDWMRNAGIVRKDGAQKDHLYAAFQAVRNREI